MQNIESAAPVEGTVVSKQTAAHAADTAPANAVAGKRLARATITLPDGLEFDVLLEYRAFKPKSKYDVANEGFYGQIGRVAYKGRIFSGSIMMYMSPKGQPSLLKR